MSNGNQGPKFKVVGEAPLRMVPKRVTGMQEHVPAPGFVGESSESIKARLGLPFDPYALEFENTGNVSSGAQKVVSA